MYSDTPRQQTGFTLIEIIVVILIVAITSTIAALAYRGYDHTRSTKNALIILEEKIQLAREYAVTHNTLIKLNISAHQATFEKAVRHSIDNSDPREDDTITWAPITDYRALSTSDFDTRILKQHTPSSNTPIIVYPIGTLSPLNIELQDRDTHYFLKMSPTGQMNIEKIDHET